jgi:hypothetical protein
MTKIGSEPTGGKRPKKSQLVLTVPNNQCTDYSITLDQSRYAALLVLQRYLNGISESDTTLPMKNTYATPIPTTTVFTKKDCSSTYIDVLELKNLVLNMLQSLDH